MKKFISLFLVISIIALSVPLTSKERKGADLIIQGTDGIQLRGWLIAVKENSLLMMERDSGADISVDVKNISVITHVRRSKGLKVVGISVASCLVVFTGTIIWADVFGPPELAEQGPIGLGLTAGLIGFIAGEVLVKNKKTIQIEGKSDSEIQEILEKLRKKARINNAQ